LFSEREKAFWRVREGDPEKLFSEREKPFRSDPRVKAGEVVLGVRESFPDEPEAAIERRRISPNLLLKSPLIQAVIHYSHITEFKISRALT
jgi:hypothetical protein